MEPTRDSGGSLVSRPVSQPVSVVVIDDHPAIIAGVTAWCEAATPPIRVAESGDTVALAWTGQGREATAIVLDLQLLRKRPMFDELHQLAQAGRPVIVYSQRTDHESALRCLELGAFTYLTKAEGKEHLVPAIVAASRSQPYLSPSLGGAILTNRAPGRPRLSPREVEVLTLWFECASKRLVAARMGLSLRTVETFIERARLKYASAGRPAPTKSALLERAYQDGLIDLLNE
jgi:DNA-binding NarL/FixJ family response regulator